VEVVDATDLVHEFAGYTTGQFTFTAWQYIPEDFLGLTYFILLSDYQDVGANNKWAVQMRFDSDLQVVESEFDAINLPLITGQWVEIRCEIDLDTDWLEMYYDGELLHEKAWTAGPNNAGDGLLNIAAVDLYANAATAVYYDDLELVGETQPVPVICCQGDLRWEDIDKGSTVTGQFEVSNCGVDGSELNWEVSTWPSWGTWTFTPASGTGLTTAAGWIPIDVEVVAPAEKNEFTGTIKVVNSDDPTDYCEISVYMSTPRARLYSFPIIQKILERFPLLSELLGI
jgi:hypothetical protein